MDNYKIYNVEREEKLSSIAEKYNTTPEAIKAANPNMSTFRAFIGGEFISAMQQIKIPISKLVKSESVIENEYLSSLEFEKKARYRCEQTVITKLNGVVQNHADTKREFVVRKSKANGGLIVKVELTDNIIQVSPQPLTEAINLLSDLDLIKCDTLLQTNLITGKISKVLNHREIISKWEKHKKELQNKYEFIRSDQTKEDFNKFITLAENQIISESNLIQDMNTKLFFDLFFDKYLVTDKDLFNSYERTFYSQLFDGLPVNLKFRQDILTESEKEVVVRKVGELDKNSYSSGALEKMYDTKFKPMIKYKFSEFNFSYRERVVLNTEEQWIENSEVTMIEEVKNNIQILIDYKLNKIE